MEQSELHPLSDNFGDEDEPEETEEDGFEYFQLANQKVKHLQEIMNFDDWEILTDQDEVKVEKRKDENGLFIIKKTVYFRRPAEIVLNWFQER